MKNFEYTEPYPRGVEVVSSPVIENQKAEILLTQSPKWHNKWLFPGGHVEKGESIIAAAIREGQEETGLILKGIEIFHFGEMIGSKDFHRPAHFVFFDVYCTVMSGTLKLDPTELSSYKWVHPQEALTLDLAESYRETLNKFIEFRKNNL